MNLAKALGLFLLSSLYVTFLSSQSIYINEFMASNDQTIADEYDEYDDWVEFYNAGTIPFDLGGKYVTDDLNEPSLWQIPTTDPSLTTIPAGGYLILWFDGDTDQGVLHVDLKLGSSGEQIGLYDTDGITPIDALTFGEQIKDVSQGRSPDGSPFFVKFDDPTPNRSNEEAASETVARPMVSMDGGLYDASFLLSITTTTNNATIFYTTDGSEPDETGIVYSTPILINTSQVIKAKAFKAGATASETITNTYFVNVNHSFPIVSITGDSTLFFDEATGLFPNYEEDIEIPLNIEFYETDGTQGFNQLLEVEIHGSTSAILDQKSLALKAKGSLGSKIIDYPIFPDRDQDEYRSLILRNSGQDWEYTLFRDALESDLVTNLDDLEINIVPPNLDGQAYRPVVTYLNGQYWGIYNLRERSDRRYIKTHYDLDEDEIDLLENLDEAKEGDFEAWNQLDSLLRANVFIDDDGLATLANLVDIDNYMDYLIHNIFLDNTDWPGNNYLRWRERSPEGKWRWMTKDLDFGFGFVELDTENFNTGNPNINSLDRLLNPSFFYPNPDWATILFNRLIENPTWRQDFINRMADQLNVLFSKERVLEKINTFQANYQPEINQHNQKWENIWTWNQDVDVLRTFAAGRTEAVRNHFVESISAVTGTSKVALNTIPDNGGNIKISTVTTNQNSMPWVGTYFNGIDIPLQAIANPGFRFVGWSTNVNSTDVNGIINLSGDVAITAIFVPEGDMVGPLNQVIDFSIIADKNINDDPFELMATASSGLPVTLAVISGPAILDGNIITLDGTTGTVFLQASQAGNDDYNAATTVSRFFEVTDEDIVLPPPPTNMEAYCTSSGEQPWEEYIASVQLGNINNASGKDKYGDFLNQSTSLSVGEQYPISLTPGFSWSHYDEAFSIWIDWNQDNDFEDAAEQVYTGILPAGTNGAPANPLIGIINVPNDVPLGTTRMRISMERNQGGEPCGMFTFGETEDYTLMIVDGGAANLEVICPAPITLNAPANAAEVSVEWEAPVIATDCPEGIQSILQTSGLPSGSLFPIGSSIITYVISDNCGNTTTCTFEIKVSPSGSYCSTKGNQPWQEYIAQVELNTLNNNSFKEGYGDFTNLTTTLETGSEYEIGLRPGFSFFQWDEAFQVWIDFDGNGSFAEDGELIYSGIYAAQIQNTRPPTLTGTFSIPNSIQPINTRMRIAMRRNTAATSCETFEFGEVEDYSIQIIRGNSSNSRTAYLNFAAFNAGRAVELQWLTNTIDKSEEFTVERSPDGITFKTLKNIDQFNHHRIDAFFKEIDTEPLVGDNYYRLKQSLKDGTIHYTPNQLVKFRTDLKAITVFPNPASTQLHIQLSEFAGKAGTIQLFDAFGRLQQSAKIEVLPTDLVSISVRDLSDGVYYLSIQLAHGKVFNRKVIVNRGY